MFYLYTEEELRSLCRNNLESYERWARQLIHEQMTSKYGQNYFDYKNPDGNNLIKTAIINNAKEKMNAEPSRFSRLIDTLFFEDITYFLCNRKWYDELFKEIFRERFTFGCDQLRGVLDTLQPIRNALSHSNPISVRQAEMVVCYTHDIIDCIKEYYKKMGKEQIWNVPHIIRAVDSRGVVYSDIKNDNHTEVCHIKQAFSVGDTYSIAIDIDPSFDADQYDIFWIWKNNQLEKNSKKVILSFSEKDVGLSNFLECIVVSHKPWHKFGRHDQRILFPVDILPPVND